MSSPKDKEDYNIRVHVRIRPLNKSEIIAGSEKIIDVVNETEIHTTTHDKNYSFDHVYSPHSTQEEVYRNSVEMLIDDIIKGFNVTVFAYGQTGSGKTYTMGGASAVSPDDEHAGIIPRAVVDLYNALESRKGWFLKVSFLELYNEVLIDLLDEERQEIRIMEKEGMNVLFPCPERHVQSLKELFRLLELGTSKRSTSSTNLNEQSSRSHAVFTVTVQLYEENSKGEEVMTNGKMNFVDLAGSENIGRSGAIKQRASEAGKINQSLLAIGRVINALVDRSGHIPYRESKLTRILQDSLGGNTKTTLIATVSPSVINVEETLKTLDYAYRAKKIKNHPEQTKKLTKKFAINMFTNEILRLRKDLEAQRTKVGIHLSKDSYNEIMGEYNTTNHELTERQRVIGILEKRLEELLEDKKKKEDELFTCQKDVEEANKEYEESKKELDFYKKKCEESELIVTHVGYKYEKLSAEANKLLDVVKTSTHNKDILGGKVTNLYERSQKQNRSVEKMFRSLKESQSKLSQAISVYEKSFHNQMKILYEETDKTKDILNSRSKISFGMLENLGKQTESAYNLLMERTTDAKEKIKNSNNQSVTMCSELMTRLNSHIKNSGVENIICLLKYFKDYTDEYVKDLDTQNRNVCNEINKCIHLVDTFTKDVDSKSLNYKCEVTKRIDILTDELRKQSESFNGLKTECLEISEHVNSNTHNIFDDINSLKEELHKKCKTVHEKWNESDEIHKSVVNKADQVKDFITNSCESMKMTNDKFSSNISDCFNNVVRAYPQNITRAELSEENIHELKEQLWNFDSSNDFNNINSKLAESLIICEDYKNQIETIALNLHSTSEEVTKDALNGQSSQEIDINSLIQSVKDIKNAQYEVHVTFMVFTSDMKRDFKNLVEDEFEVILPSGDTPKRVEYVYPKKLTRIGTKHEAVLERYQSVLSELQNLDQEKSSAKDIYLKYLDRFEQLSDTPRKENFN